MREHPFGLVALVFVILGAPAAAEDRAVDFDPADVPLLGAGPEGRAVLKGKYDGKLVRVAGVVTAAGKDDGGQFFLVQVENPRGGPRNETGTVLARTPADARGLRGHEVVVRGKASVDPKDKHPLVVEARHVQVDPGKKGQDPPGGAGAPKGAPEELKRLEGTWTPVALESGGERVTGEELKKLGLGKFTVRDGKTSIRGGGEVSRAALRVDPTRKPRAMDRVVTEGRHQGLTSLAVYDLAGDTLTICYDAENSDKRRPREFTSSGTQVILVLKRNAP
jgi:uncharacterized protein (TIGR03067 family)